MVDHGSNHLAIMNLSSKAQSRTPAATGGKSDGGSRGDGGGSRGDGGGGGIGGASSRPKSAALQFILTVTLAFAPADSFYNIKEPDLDTRDVLEKYQLYIERI